MQTRLRDSVVQIVAARAFTHEQQMGKPCLGITCQRSVTSASRILYMRNYALCHHWGNDGNARSVH